MAQGTQILNYSNGLYPLVLLMSVLIVLVIVGVWFVFKSFRGHSNSTKENENPADKNFVDYLSEESLQAVQESKVKDRESYEDASLISGEGEILKLAKKYNMGQGEVELLLSFRSKKTKKINEYIQVAEAVEKGGDIKRLAKKYKVGCGEIQLILNLKSVNQNAFLKKWR